MGSFNVNPTTILSKIHVRTPTQAESLSSRYSFLNLNNAEPNLGKPPGIYGGTYYSTLTSDEYLGIRYALLSNNHSGSAWRVWAYDNPRIAAYSKEGSLGIGDNAYPLNIKSFVYSNYAFDNQNNRYNSQSFSNKTFNVFALSGIYLFDSTTIGDPASAIAFIVTDTGNVGIGTENPPATLSIIGTISGSNFTTSFNSGSATGERSFAVNEGIAIGFGSHAEGASLASGPASHAEGTSCIASGDSSHAEGFETEAPGDYSHAEGQGSEAIGLASHAEGGSTASGAGSHAEGDATEALGYASHSEGNSTIAAGDSSHAEGLDTKALGDFSHAEGEETVASGVNSHAAGRWAQAAHDRTWIWKGDTGVNLLSTTRTDQFMVSAAGGIFLPGNVGIGTDNNNFNLYVRKNSVGATPDPNSIAVFEGGGNAHITILTPDAQTGGVVFGSPSDNYGSYLSWNHDNNALKLATAKNNGFIQLLTNNEVEAVRITNSGNVGIGTTVPGEKLTVNGAISASEGIKLGRTTILPGISAATLMHATTALSLSITDILLKINIGGTDYALPLYNYTT